MVLCEFWCMWTNVVLCEEGNKKGGALGKGEAETDKECTRIMCTHVYVDVMYKYTPA